MTGKELVMPSPAIVLVHGAFGDASSWRPVYDRLAGDGHTVLAPPNPLRGIPYDASFTASIIDQIDGPVVLVGRSYGGAVITVAGSSDKVAGSRIPPWRAGRHGGTDSAGNSPGAVTMLLSRPVRAGPQPPAG
jgi:hypothetical protein